MISEQTIVLIEIVVLLPYPSSISVNIIVTLGKREREKKISVYASQTVDVERALKKTYGLSCWTTDGENGRPTVCSFMARTEREREKERLYDVQWANSLTKKEK